MKIQRVIKVGDSLAVVLPWAMREELNLKQGDYVRIEYILDKERPAKGYGIVIWKMQSDLKKFH